MRRGMVIAQIALSLVLLTTGGLVVRSFERLLSASPTLCALSTFSAGEPTSIRHGSASSDEGSVGW